MAKIILAEDDNAMRQFIASSLQKAGHEVLAHANGLDAYNSLRQTSCDLLLTDIVMPEMDGLELAKKATALYPTLDIVFITGFAASLINAKDQTNLHTRVISKPFHLGKLTQEINDILAKNKHKAT